MRPKTQETESNYSPSVSILAEAFGAHRSFSNDRGAPGYNATLCSGTRKAGFCPGASVCSCDGGGEEETRAHADHMSHVFCGSRTTHTMCIRIVSLIRLRSKMGAQETRAQSQPKTAARAITEPFFQMGWGHDPKITHCRDKRFIRIRLERFSPPFPVDSCRLKLLGADVPG